jgi:hypothetical protein
MLNYLEIVTTVSSVLLLKADTPEHTAKKEDLWAYIKEVQPDVYDKLRHRLMGRLLHLKGRPGRALVLFIYKITQKIYGFN